VRWKRETAGTTVYLRDIFYNASFSDKKFKARYTNLYEATCPSFIPYPASTNMGPCSPGNRDIFAHVPPCCFFIGRYNLCRRTFSAKGPYCTNTKGLCKPENRFLAVNDKVQTTSTLDSFRHLYGNALTEASAINFLLENKSMLSLVLAHRSIGYNFWVNENRRVHQSYRSQFQSKSSKLYAGSNFLKLSAQIYQFLCEHNRFRHLSYLTELSVVKTSIAIL